ncbi:hypothetical protein F3J38_06095 [Pantoea sp. Acro-805]|jgi:hypothetical protein|uniref:Uncharacterized protein n=1 Tax=Candidatus Pantoea formicae TaxID=2608355 RepID=A0ABX0QS98_9GAMM|nr:hypothetical protein [Erwiniaceae bacterium L1_54_3]NIE99648.1 hypothetical protein [Pantoea formicae]
MKADSARGLRQKGALLGNFWCSRTKNLIKYSTPELCLASCTEFGCFTLTIACCFAKTLPEAENI